MAGTGKRWKLPLFSGQELGNQTGQVVPPPVPPIPGICSPPGCVLWLDSANPSSLRTGSGNKVYQWLDRSGSGNHTEQPDAAFQPTRILGTGVRV